MAWVLRAGLSLARRALVKKARNIHRSILTYAGDLRRSDGEAAAALVLASGTEATSTPMLRNEIYVQIMKHCTANEIDLSLQVRSSIRSLFLSLSLSLFLFFFPE